MGWDHRGGFAAGGACSLSKREVTRSGERGPTRGRCASFTLTKELIGAQGGTGDVVEFCWGFQFQIYNVVAWMDGRSKGLEDG